MQFSTESNDTSTIWTDPPEVRAKRRTALVDLYVIGRPIASGDNRYGATFSHIFKPGQMAIDETHFAAFAAGDYVRISTRQRCAIAAGRVTAITANTIAVNLERDLSRVFPRERFILDRTESNASMMRTNAANLGQLMVDTEPMARFRRLIIDKCPPTFDEPSPRLLEEMSVEARVQFDQLNEGQKTGVVRGVGAKDYLLLRGLPGSGKTQTIAVLVMFLAEMGQRVLVTSHTHSAIDTVLTRVLRYGCEAVRSSYILRLGDDERIAPAIRPFGHRERTKECKTAEELRELYATYVSCVCCVFKPRGMVAIYIYIISRSHAPARGVAHRRCDLPGCQPSDDRPNAIRRLHRGRSDTGVSDDGAAAAVCRASFHSHRGSAAAGAAGAFASGGRHGRR